jgi:hypothetical protein
MEQLSNSFEVAIYCTAYEEGKAGHACRSADFNGREKLIFDTGHQDGKSAALRAFIWREFTALGAMGNWTFVRHNSKTWTQSFNVNK